MVGREGRSVAAPMAELAFVCDGDSKAADLDYPLCGACFGGAVVGTEAQGGRFLTLPLC